MRKLGYKITIVYLIHFQSSHNQGLHDIAKSLIDLRKHDLSIVRTIAKISALQGIGRFALNVGKKCNTEVELISNTDELTINIEKNLVKNIEFWGNSLIVYKEKQLSNNENKVLSSRLNCSSLVFGSLSNAVRVEIYKFYLYLKKYEKEGVSLIRIDTDSLRVSFKKKHRFEIVQNFINKSFFKFKIEIDEIEEIVSLSKKSHYIKTRNLKILEVTGLSISLKDRCQL